MDAALIDTQPGEAERKHKQKQEADKLHKRLRHAVGDAINDALNPRFRKRQ